MYEVFTTVPGLVLQIGTSGWAFPESVDPKDPQFAGLTRAVVTDEAGEQFEREIRGHYQDTIEETVDDPENPGMTKTVKKQITVKFGRGPNPQLRVRKIAPAAPAVATKAPTRVAPPAAEKKEL